MEKLWEVVVIVFAERRTEPTAGKTVPTADSVWKKGY
jgi:hypothetical protein